jgi:hypothetical protein
MTPDTFVTPRAYRSTTFAFYLSLAALLSWLPVLLFRPWTMYAFPAMAFLPAVVSLRLAFATRRRVKQGLEVQPRPGRLALTFVFSGFHTLVGGLAVLFLLLVALWFFAFVKGAFL